MATVACVKIVYFQYKGPPITWLEPTRLVSHRFPATIKLWNGRFWFVSMDSTVVQHLHKGLVTLWPLFCPPSFCLPSVICLHFIVIVVVDGINKFSIIKIFCSELLNLQIRRRLGNGQLGNSGTPERGPWPFVYRALFSGWLNLYTHRMLVNDRFAVDLSATFYQPVNYSDCPRIIWFLKF